jgi:uncharacterized protein YbjT (DUF2867 family)
MRIAVAGGTGLVGDRVVAALRRAGHHPVVIARSKGVDLLADDSALHAPIAGAEAVIDVTNTPTTDPEQARQFFGTATQKLIAAELASGVRHHITLSILGLDRIEGNGHYAGKRVQEHIARDAEIPATIVRAAQFFEFPEMVLRWTRRGDSATVPPLLIQPLAVRDLAQLLAELAAGAPANDTIEVAGPEPHDLVDMARRTLAARGEDLRLIPSWHGPFGPEMAGDVLLPSHDSRHTATTFDHWLTDLTTRTGEHHANA